MIERSLLVCFVERFDDVICKNRISVVINISLGYEQWALWGCCRW